MFKTYLLGCFVLLLSLGTGYACDEEGYTGIVPENDVFIGVNDKSSNGITQREFNQVFDRIEKVYSSIFYQNGETLSFKRDWKEGIVNAYAYKKDSKAYVVINGGLARHSEITVDAIALTACHEIGHHIGGIPVKKKGPGRILNGRVIKKSWASSEGQADYFGVMKCFRKYIEGDDNEKIVTKLKLPSATKKKCEAEFSDREEQAICKRSMSAALSLTRMFTQLINESLEKAGKDFRLPPVSLLKTDKKVVSKHDDKHPLPQCRLDTFFQASLCEKHHGQDVSYEDYSTGVCARSNGYDIGIRPKCWFKPPRS
ncbi:MAG: hypothetical protein DRQ88_03560 [Epsilonproteobacteria bacterium]|nr:MAG: hypothetical protein DRQ89_03930 [Campylobacterota bacterium]RLA67251.1 MAG: hypothetical protein DRQ88_03560 [Campylobacterota bacterium]